MSTPHVKEEQETTPVYLSDAEYSHPPQEGPSPPVEGWLHTLHQKCQKLKTNQETRIDSQTTRTCSSKKEGVAR